MHRPGVIEGQVVTDILLDTGSSRSLVRQELVSDETLLQGESVAICCAHGDTVFYPVAELEVEIGGRKMKVKAAVSETLPMSMLVGTDVPQLIGLLQEELPEPVTEAQAECQRRAEEEALQCEKQSSEPGSLELEENVPAGEEGHLTEDLGFVASQAEKVEKSRTEQGTEKRNCWVEKYSPDADEDAESALSNQALDVSPNEMKVLTVQNTDNTPEIVLRAIEDVSSLAKVMRATKDPVGPLPKPMARSETIVEEESESNRENVLLWKKDCTQEQTSQSQGLLDKLETNKFVLGKGGGM